MSLQIDLGTIAGCEWDGHIIWRDGLIIPGWRGEPLTPADLRATFWRLQELSTLRHECERLKTETARAEARADQQEARAEYYRRQLRLESSAGSMLARIFTD